MNNPVARFFEPLLSVLRMIVSRVSKIFDQIVYSRKASFIVSGIISLLICISLYSGEIRLELFQSEIVTQSFGNIPIEVQIDTSVYEVSGMPDTAAVSVSGPQAEVQVFRNQNNLAVIADLRGLTEGTSEIALSAANVPSPLEASLDPETVTVTIERKITRSFIVTPELLLGSGQNREEFGTIELSASSVSITGTLRKIDSIRAVKAIIDGSGKDTDFEAEAIVVAYDSSGRQVSGITINPASLTATVAASSGDDTTAENAES